MHSGRIVTAAVLAGAIFVAPPALEGCSTSGCAGASQNVLSIYVRDAATLAVICDATVSLTIDGVRSYADFTSGGTDCHFVGGNDPGTYTVEVSKTGYQTTTTTIVVPVAHDDPACPVGVPQKATVDLKAPP